ncbi:MAG TPA: metallophosphoesterase, partial [Cyclobacteriaceae bacterium]|nr:metallophosphoesterase [Cyclobacteriaceae bacterium]
NGNGIKDKNETGIRGVAVSDQVNVVVTDTNGAYQLTDSKGFGVVFVSIPMGYKPLKSYYQKVDLGLNTVQADFALTKAAAPASFKFIHASDTHISDKSLGRFTKFRAAVDSVKPDFVVVTGDLVRDALRVPEKEATSLYEMYKTESQKISQPVWSVPGNHEIFGIERHLSLVSQQHPLYGRKMFRHYLGPDYYSFNYGGLHFVALNSLEFEDLWYYGSIDSVQREWLKKDLAAIPPSMPVVTFQHVPFISGELSLSGFTANGPGRTLELEKGELKFRHVVSNAHEIISLLRTHPFPLALGGHHHTRQLFFLETEGQQTRFEQAAAIVGPVEGDGFKMPSGITVYNVKDGKIDDGTFVKIP